jgi:hypothetical protein
MKSFVMDFHCPLCTSFGCDPQTTLASARSEGVRSARLMTEQHRPAMKLAGFLLRPELAPAHKDRPPASFSAANLDGVLASGIRAPKR